MPDANTSPTDSSPSATTAVEWPIRPAVILIAARAPLTAIPASATRWPICNVSPTHLRRKILRDQGLVIRPQGFRIGTPGALGVQIVGIKGAHPLEHPAVLIVHQVLISALPVAGIERVIPDHVERLLRQVGF